MKMVNKQGIELLEKCREEIQNYYGRDTELTEEISSYLTTNGWIPCIEKYPEECERVIVWDSLNNRIAIAYFSCPHWEADDGRINAIAWQPLPEPYKEVFHG